MTETDKLKQRSKDFAIRVVKMWKLLPRTEEARVLGKQVLRSGTSVAANYRSVCRARSKAEFIAKIGVVVEEIDETVFWLEMLVETEIVPAKKMQPLLKEANELFAIFHASKRTAQNNTGPKH